MIRINVKKMPGTGKSQNMRTLAIMTGAARITEMVVTKQQTSLKMLKKSIVRTVLTRDGKTWYGRNSNGEFYRYQGSNGRVQWNGRKNSGRGLKAPRYIRDRFKGL